MKRIICIILLIILSFILCGCSDANKFPQLKICRSTWRADTIHVALRDGHNFNIHHLYDEVETENGYDIVVHIVKNK